MHYSKLNQVMDTLSPSELHYFIDVVFDLIKEEDENVTINELMRIKKLASTYKKFKQLDEDKQEGVKEVLKTIFKIMLLRR